MTGEVFYGEREVGKGAGLGRTVVPGDLAPLADGPRSAGGEVRFAGERIAAGAVGGSLSGGFCGEPLRCPAQRIGTLVAALAAAAVFAGMAALLGFLMFGELGFSGQGLGALAGMGLGGLAAGLLPLGGKRRKKATGRKGRR